MAKRADLTGRTFNRLTAHCDVGAQDGLRVWLFKCSCGKFVELPGKYVVSGNTKSCGCLRTESINSCDNKASKHGHAKSTGKPSSPTYNSWFSMKSRCRIETDSAYYGYGAKGVMYAARWESFENFLEDMGERPAGTTLDRKDGTKGYSKDNCRWATHQEQADNKPSTRKYWYRSEQHTITSLAKLLCIPRGRVKYYLVEKMLSIDQMLEVLNG